MDLKGKKKREEKMREKKFLTRQHMDVNKVQQTRLNLFVNKSFSGFKTSGL